MTENKIYPQLRKLTGKKELSAFGKYLSKNYRKHTTAIALFRYIRGFQPHYLDKKLETGVVLNEIKQKIGSKRKISRITILNAYSDLNLWLKEFLIHQKANRDSLHGNLLWLEILLERSLQSEGVKQVNALRGQMEAMEEKGVDLYFKKLFVSYLDYYKIPKNTSSETYLTLQTCLSDLKALEALLHLRLACEMRNREKLSQVQNTVKGDSVSPIPANGYDSSFLVSNPLIHAYVEIYQMIVEKDDNSKAAKHFEKALKLVKLNSKTLPLEDKYAILTYLENYVINQINNGKNEYLRKAHDLHLLGEKMKVYTLKDIMDEVQYLNIALVACRNKKFIWAEKFIEDHITKIDERERDSILSIARAMMAFWQKKYEDVLNIINAYASDNDIKYAVRSKPFFLACQYELHIDKNDEFIISICNAFEKQISRQKAIKSSIISGLLSFSQILKKLAKKNASKELILKEINSKKSLVLKDWLLEKAAAYQQ